MDQVTRTQSIKMFLNASTHADLAVLYSHDMECQVNVAQDGGKRTDGEFKGRHWHGWTDGIQTWKSFRIPRNANSTPEYEDVKMAFDLAAHAEGIGMTGWNWKKRCSRWVAFDFDAISGHKDAHSKKLSEDELIKIKDSLKGIDWVTIRKSTGGKGLHIYVFLDSVPTLNHNEHAALARSILGKMSALAQCDFDSKVDVCGSNMWVWHRKMSPDNEGLRLIKQGNILRDVPSNWKDHIKVVTGHRRTNLPKFLSTGEWDAPAGDAEKLLEELTSLTVHVPLDDEHKKLILWLEEKKTQSWWDADRHMLVTHTHHLKDAHIELGLRGIFDTVSAGREAGHDHNCFMYPMRFGGWVIRRFGMGTQEKPSWDQDGRGWTRCFYNVTPDLGTAARSKGGIEHPSGGYVFTEAESALDAAKNIGAPEIKLAPSLRPMKAKLKSSKEGRLVIEVEGDSAGLVANEMTGWLHEKGLWKRVINVQTSVPTEAEVGNYDDILRHVVNSGGDDFGWVLKGEGNEWRSEPLKHIMHALESMGINSKELKNVVGSSVIKCWRLVNYPFKGEYPGNRLWNRGAAQLRFIPSQNEERQYPTWSKILNHIGQGLDEAIANHPWAKANGITKGSDYLKIWLASLFKEPMQPLPYLFFWGNQDSGKSIFHEAVSLLFTRGYQRAESALTNQQGFNAQLDNAVLCVVEEIDLRKNKEAANRIKDWVTARQISIHPKGKTPYLSPNSTHWVQCSNDQNACPIFPGDTRITMIRVEDLDPVEKIPKKAIIPLLEKEAPDFLGELMALEIPPSNDRLNVPVIATLEKIEIEKSNRTSLESFIADHCYEISGQMIKFSDFYDRFRASCEPDEAINWSKIKVGREIPHRFPKGRSRQNMQLYIGNISFDSKAEILPKLKAVTDDKDLTFLEHKK